MLRFCFFSALCLLAFPTPAYAYLDPGTGSMLVSALIGVVATLFFLVKGLWYRGIGFFYGLLGKQHHSSKDSIVFYSEGRQYWQVFKPVIDGLAALSESCTYLTSDLNDPGLEYEAQGFKACYIGTGNKAFAAMNILEADICVMTTPGLDVLQIRRSPGVKHYAHVVHAPGDVSMYRLYGLDYYDSLLASGPHQEKSVRELERQRGTKPKKILHSGCPYYDVLMQMKRNAPQAEYSEKTTTHILVAPTWGINGLLARYGTSLLTPLAEAGYEVTVRPHPQSLMVEAPLLEKIKAAMAPFANVHWDTSPNNFAAMMAADILISDYSSIIFDFAFIMERPALTMDFTPDLSPYDAFDLPEKSWDMAVQPQLGQRITLDDVPRLAEIVASLLAQPDFTSRLLAFRDANVYNLGCSGLLMAEQLLALRNEAQ